jgi:hypothetical protein
MTEETVHDYIAMLRDSSRSVRSSAAVTLSVYKEDAEIVVPALIKALKDEAEQVRCDAAWAIGSIGTFAYGAPEALSKASENDPCKEVRLAAKSALASLRRKREAEVEHTLRREGKSSSRGRSAPSLFAGFSLSQKQVGRSTPYEELSGKSRADGSADQFTLRDEANAIVAYAFRNGPIENLHAGKYSELLTDQSLSRITNEEMKTIMLNACRKVEELLLLKDSDPDEYERRLRVYNDRDCHKWER